MKTITIFDHIQKLKKTISHNLYLFVNNPPPASVIKIFRTGVYIWSLLYLLHLLPVVEEIFGPNAYVAKVNTENMGLLTKSLNLLWIPSFENYYYPFIVALIGFLIVGIIGLWPRMTSAIIFFMTFNVYNKSYVTLDGGNNLMILMMFYLILMGLPSKNKNQSNLSRQFNNSIARSGLFLARFQLCIVYACAALGKVAGELWPKGVALYYTLNVTEYTHPLAQKLIANSSFLVTAGSLGTVAFQLAFPLLIWNKKLRTPLMLLGTGLHLGISLVMGLVFFGFSMLIAYTVFYTEEKAAKILKLFSLPNRIVVGFDPNCSVCQKVALWVQRLDVLKMIKIDNSLYPQNLKLAAIDLDIRQQRMTAVDLKTFEAVSGFDSVLAICRRIIALLPLYPLMLMVAYTGLGSWIYDVFAVKSNWRKACANGHCEI